MIVNKKSKKIILREQKLEIAKKIQEKFNLSYICSCILAARGYRANEDLEKFLNPTLKTGLPDPVKLKGINEVTELILEAIGNNEKIAICSDFDVDGLTSSAQMFCFFDALNIDSRIYVPDRFTEGYGLNKRMIDEAKKDERTLLISLDFGTTNVDEVQYAKELGFKTIVIDHHHVGDNDPKADAFINPKQKNCQFSEYELCTAGLVWYVIIYLSKKLKEKNIEIDYKSYLDLAAMGTICDMVPLIKANRVIAKRGLEALNITKRIGIQALKNVSALSNKQLDCYDISFNLGPRLNSAGRLDTGEIVSELLTTKNEKRAKTIATKLDKLNAKRQKIEEDVKKECIKQVNNLDEIPYGICAWHPDFHTGVVGIVAQRLVETYYKPSVVLGLSEDNIFKGSIRGIEGFSVISCLESLSKYLFKFGGHEMAGGVSIKKEYIKDFAIAFNEYCKKNLTEDTLAPKVYADAIINLKDLDKKTVNELNLFSPYGVSNSAPLLLCKNLEVKKVFVLKDTHLKVLLYDKDSLKTFTGMIWKQTSHAFIKEGNIIDVLFKPTINIYLGLEEIQGNIVEVKLSDD